MSTNTRIIQVLRETNKPRPLKISSGSSRDISSPPLNNIENAGKSIEDIFSELEKFYSCLSDFVYNENTAAQISSLCFILKARGAELDATDQTLMDRYFIAIRNTSREDSLDVISRLKLLEVIEMRSMKWKINENIVHYYKKKIVELEQGTEQIPAMNATSIAHNYSSLISNPISVPLAPGEVIRSSGKFPRPTKIAGKNYFKDEVIIRNSDSGKVSPGARDRLVQITGPNEESISHAKTLVEDTIRKNALPVVDKGDPHDLSEMEDLMLKRLSHSHSMTDASVGEYTSKLKIDGVTITLSSLKPDLVKASKAVLQAYFESRVELEDRDYSLSAAIHNLGLEDNDYKDSGQQWTRTWMRTSESRTSGSSSEDEVFRDQRPGQVVQPDPESFPRVKAPVPRTNSTPYGNFEQVAAEKVELNRSISLPVGTSESIPSILPPEPKKYAYTRDQMLKISKSPLCSVKPVFLLNEGPVDAYQYILRDRYTAHRSSF